MPGAEAKKTAIDRWEALEGIRSRWIGNFRHDLSSSLFAARGYLRMFLREQQEAPAESRQSYVVAALEQLGKLAGLVEELDGFPESGKFVFDLVSIPVLVREAVDSARGALDKKNARLTEHVSPLSTLGDPVRLAQSFRRILHGVVDFTESGGAIEVRAYQKEETIVLEIAAASTDCERAAERHFPDISADARVWRTHGGSCLYGGDGKSGFQVSCELPILRPPEC